MKYILKYLPIIIAAILVPFIVLAINLSSFAIDTEFTQTQLDSKDLSTIGMGFNITKKEVNGNNFNAVYTYLKVVPNETGYVLIQETATSSYSVDEYRICRGSKSKAECKGNVKTKIVKKIKSLLDRERDLMRDLQSSSSVNYDAELAEIILVNSEIE